MKLARVWGLGVLLLCNCVYSRPCSEIVRNPRGNPFGYPVHSVRTSSTAIALTTALPDYKPSEEMIFFFLPDLHAALFVGGYYWNHWGIGEGANVTVHANAKAAPHGLAVRVRIGEKAVSALVKTMADGLTPRAQTNSCHLNQLAFLQRHGIHLRGGTKLMGTSTLREILETGFVDERGVALPTREAVIIEQLDQDQVAQFEEVRTRLHSYPAVSLSHFGWPLGLSWNELLQEILNRCPHGDFAAAMTLFSVNPDSPLLSAAALTNVQAYLETLEGETLRLTQERFGMNSSQLLEIMAYQKEQIPVAAVREILISAIEHINLYRCR